MADRSPAQLRRCGGHPALDFINTVDWRGRSEPDEYLCRYADLLLWSELAGMVSQRAALRLRRSVSRADGMSVVDDAIALRESAQRAIVAAMNGKRPKDADLQRIDGVVREARENLALDYDGAYFRWGLADAIDRRSPLWTIALSIADLLASEHLRSVRECGGPECGWLFLDTSKNHSRRWCSMDGCGNRAKARRHYRRGLSSTKPADER